MLICRSGKRSRDAGAALEAAGFTRLLHVDEGFEGDLDDNNHRNTINGWRAAGLPWAQF
jgi:rhodanese-related sulfurtransferase